MQWDVGVEGRNENFWFNQNVKLSYYCILGVVSIAIHCLGE